MRPNSAVRLDGVTAAYEHNVVFKNSLPLEIRAGQFAGIVGTDGCGKTTLLKTILGTHPVDSGNVQLNGDSDREREAGHHRLCATVGKCGLEFPLLPWKK